jgi:hypothetical protein
LNLKDWKLTLPEGSSGSPKEIDPAALTAFVDNTAFHPDPSCDAVVFRAPVNGVTTSGSKNPRSELREMTDGSPASWSSDSGTHTLTVVEAFTELPEGKPQLVGAQIHDATDDITVFRLEGSNLYVTDGNNPHFKLITNSYRLGTRYEAKYVVSGGKITAFYNGQPVATLTKSFSGAYFKAGAYTQANCSNVTECSSDNAGATTIWSVTARHDQQSDQSANSTAGAP